MIFRISNGYYHHIKNSYNIGGNFRIKYPDGGNFSRKLIIYTETIHRDKESEYNTKLIPYFKEVRERLKSHGINIKIAKKGTGGYFNEFYRYVILRDKN